ncbi:GNAT family protein [Alkalihalophilus lindianensis]|uniref:GNAT family protein n=1 Tax=Alkalihalophilus lindianensis TaxID=1630542 RepID=A0ABU3X4I8_9BACI|nr:GNAT family protein [Alkalihalophilus lindianensis]MDV2682805.1 GNAT family protein [Alkalihalophilus lindianensis]
MKGESVYLRTIKKKDLESLYQAIQDEEIRYMTGTRSAFSMEQLSEYYQRIMSDETRYDFSICLTGTEELIGDLSILEIDEENKKAGFRIALHHTNHFNKGYGTEALQLALQFAFDTLNLNRLQLEVFSHNVRGIKSYEKAGFKTEGIIRESLYINNHYSDEMIMGILKKEYDALKNS